MIDTSGRYLILSSYFDEPHFCAGFSLKGFSADNSHDRFQFAQQLGLDSEQLVIPKQVHGSHVHTCTHSGRLDSTDGVISTDPSIVLSIQVADCIPLIFLDKQTKEFGLIHAGWRGTAMGIITESIKESSGRTQDKIFIIGPSIRQCCFEIGPDVAELFRSNFCKKGDGDRSFLDLQGIVKDQLIEHGAVEANIIDLKACTHCEPEMYHSYRRDGKKAGRMIAMSGWL